MKLSVVIPVYNERVFFPRLLEQVRAVPYEKEIIVVDDCSTDGTREFIRELQAAGGWPGDGLNTLRVALHERNRGKGGAIRTALGLVTGDIVVVQDADLEYDPNDYPALLAPILAGRADVVYGSRFLGAPHRTHMFWHFAANRFLTLVSNIFTNLNLSDMETCYKVFKAQYAPQIRLRSERFGFDPEITARLAHLKCRFFEVPIAYYGRDYAEGKKITWKDGFVVLHAILRYNIWDR
ncbi:MAG TPA: glycosyltransferase family 2 protein [Candidatus Methanoperedens sp.]|nr:glycosyltransferase family 2 protein [Candidatus Methanoperedens sp.]